MLFFEYRIVFRNKGAKLLLKTKASKVAMSCLLVGAMIACLSFHVSAQEAGNLDDILNGQNQQTQQQTQQSQQSQNSGGNSNGLFGQMFENAPEQGTLEEGLRGAADHSNEDPDIKPATDLIQKISGIAVTALSYIAIGLLAVRVLLDLIYIGLPFTRKILANGHQGQAEQGQQGQQGQMGMTGGYGMGNGGYGMGNSYGMGGMNNQQQQTGPGIQWVSNAALNAVATDGTPGPNGKPRGPFRTYIKDMAFMLILVPVLIILAATGVLVNLGFTIGGLISGMISGFGG